MPPIDDQTVPEDVTLTESDRLETAPDFDRSAELAFVSAMLRGPQHARHFVGILLPSDFACEDCRRLFEIELTVFRTTGGVDPDAIAASWTIDPLSRVHPSTWKTVISCVTTTSNFLPAARTIIEHAQRRELFEAGIEMQMDAQGSDLGVAVFDAVQAISVLSQRWFHVTQTLDRLEREAACETA
ncbi:MAG: hypothetical protein K8U03_06895 [Planctomycetia bacterium]|nr:hypothetical protein [Planctomycetia bacterium]